MRSRSSSGTAWAYPRSRGATSSATVRDACPSGLSPLTRGNQGPAAARENARGPIPAHAGQPNALTRCCAVPRAYPRSRGATDALEESSLSIRGLSPLTRGNPNPARIFMFTEGPIPAHAGQPGARSPASSTAGAYPRSRGATLSKPSATCNPMGLSPLTRGNPSAAPGRSVVRGPIPAHAGQPAESNCSHATIRAYPRSRGATYARSPACVVFQGLSPLTRGNHRLRRSLQRLHGPIPAHAGQPRSGYRTDRPGRAYPRSRGATCAWRMARTRSRAYPRSRGATVFELNWKPSERGLSPLTRGNHRGQAHEGGPLGPIPAHAGQPSRQAPRPGQTGAYPRSRGATVWAAVAAVVAAGLSPLTRGNQEPACGTGALCGPIPAHAGQPASSRLRGSTTGAYPRSRGATDIPRQTGQTQTGLSPLTRGNLVRSRGAGLCSVLI